MPQGENLKGKKSGNNLALATSKPPTLEQKQKGWEKRRLRVSTIKEAIKFLEKEKHESIIDSDGIELEISKMAAMLIKQCAKAIKDNDTRAADLVLKYSTPIKSEINNVDANGETVIPSPVIVFANSESEILKKLGVKIK